MKCINFNSIVARRSSLSTGKEYYSDNMTTKNNTPSSLGLTAAGLLSFQPSPLRHPYKALASHLTGWWWVTASLIPRYQSQPTRRKEGGLKCQQSGAGHLLWMIWYWTALNKLQLLPFLMIDHSLSPFTADRQGTVVQLQKNTWQYSTLIVLILAVRLVNGGKKYSSRGEDK